MRLLSLPNHRNNLQEAQLKRHRETMYTRVQSRDQCYKIFQIHEWASQDLMKSFAQFYFVEWLDRKNCRHFSNQIKVIDRVSHGITWHLENKIWQREKTLPLTKKHVIKYGYRKCLNEWQHYQVMGGRLNVLWAQGWQCSGYSMRHKSNNKMLT